MRISGLDTGLSALQVNQSALNIVGNDIANAQTPGYHNETPQLAESLATDHLGLYFGSGVTITDITRAQNASLDVAVNGQATQAGATSSQLDSLQQIQGLLAPTGGSTIGDLLNTFFSNVEQLASQPSDLSQRQVVLASATTLANGLNNLSSGLQQLGGNLTSQANQLVAQINSQAQNIAQLNSQIQSAEAQGGTPDTLLDQRDQLINQLAGNVGVQTVSEPYGQTTVLVDGAPLVMGGQTQALQVQLDQSGNLEVTSGGSTQPLTISGGQLGGVLQVYNQALPGYQNQLNTFAQAVAQGVDSVQATGLGLNGPSSFASGQRGVSNTQVPLAQAGLSMPVQAGSLYVSVTNLATGAHTLSQVQIDPNTQSLQDVAKAISGVAHIQGVVNSQTGTLQVLAQPGYAFDFAGQLPTTPQNVAITGTAVPQVTGTYTGTENNVYNFKVVGSGTVGVTPNLTLQVTDSSGNLLSSLKIGQGYTAGSPLQVADGVSVQLGSGTVNNGDSFSTPVVARPDTSGILAALGINSFFSGTNASDLQVNPNLLANPQELAAGHTSEPSDGSNLQELLALQNDPTMAGGTQTYGQFFDGIVGTIGAQVQNLNQLQTNQQAMTQQLNTQQQSVEGVDPNEALVQMLQFQRSYQSAAQYISTVNQALDSLLQILQ